jgi:esterase/lipase superfamily enzyme
MMRTFVNIQNPLFLVCIILSGISMAANNLPFIEEDVQVNAKVYVLSNRVITFENDTPITDNLVKTEASLDYLVANTSSTNALQITKSDSTSFINEMAAQKGNWLVFIHGDAKTLEASIKRGLTIQQVYNINVLIFSWPSKDPEIRGVKNLKESQTHVGESMHHFMKVMDFIVQFKAINPAFQQEQKLTLFLHSLGNLYIKTMIENDLTGDLPTQLFDNVILNAAAVNQKQHKQWLERLNMQKRIYVISNKDDFNLKGLRIFTKSGRQLGEKLTPSLADNANYVHFDKSVGFNMKKGQSHTYFMGNAIEKSSNIKSFYATLFHGEEVNLKDTEKFYVRKDELGYEIIAKVKL